MFGFMKKEDLENKVSSILKDKFLQYDVENVPDIENNSASRLTHGNTGLHGEFTFLYVDMRGSSTYTDRYRLHTITKIYKAFHHCMVECIKHFNGKVRSFDGDRVLAVFDGNRKVDNAIECAMKMVGCRYEILQPMIEKAFSNGNFSIGIGVATGNVMVSKAGVGYDKNTRDLIWIGNAPNLGAKLSDEVDKLYNIYICSTTFSKLLDNNRYTTKNGIKTDMWKKDNFNFKDGTITIYKTGYYLPL
jgi:class 3 adenylate cyclase